MSSSAHLRSLWALAHPAPPDRDVPARVPLLVRTPTGTAETTGTADELSGDPMSTDDWDGAADQVRCCGTDVIDCPDCAGSGSLPGPATHEPCPTCGGTGEIDRQDLVCAGRDR